MTERDFEATGPLPWQAVPWDRLVQRLRSHSLPHALLLTGPRGVGKLAFALAFARLALCEGPRTGDQPCGDCQGCELLRAGNHPDFSLLTPAEDGKPITIDQIRQTTVQLGIKSQQGGHKVVILSPSHQMNTAAANALLKTLEEPTAQSLLLLVSDHPERLPPTVRSRCQRIVIDGRPREAALTWLQGRLGEGANAALLLDLSGGAPLAALELAGQGVLPARRSMLGDLEKLMENAAHPADIANSWLAGQGGRAALGLLHSCTMDLIRLQFGGDLQRVMNRDLAEPLRQLAARMEPMRLYRFLDKLTEALRLANTQVNMQLLLEDVLIDWPPLRCR